MSHIHAADIRAQILITKIKILMTIAYSDDNTTKVAPGFYETSQPNIYGTAAVVS